MVTARAPEQTPSINLSNRPIGGTPLSPAEAQAVYRRYPTTIEEYNQRESAIRISDDTVLYRWSPETTGLGGNGTTFWTTRSPIQGYETRYLFQTTVGELRRQGVELRIDEYATGLEPGSESILVMNRNPWARVPATRLDSVATDHSGRTPLFLNSNGQLVTSDGNVWTRGILLPDGRRIWEEDMPSVVQTLRNRAPN